MITRTDPVDVFRVLQGVYGSPARGRESVQAACGGIVPSSAPSSSRRGTVRPGSGLWIFFHQHWIRTIVAELLCRIEHSMPATRHNLRSGASLGSLRGSSYAGSENRRLAFAEYGVGILHTPYSWALRGGLKLHGSVGRTTASRDTWSRAVARASLSLSRAGRAVAASFAYGQVNSSAPDYGALHLGGESSRRCSTRHCSVRGIRCQRCRLVVANGRQGGGVSDIARWLDAHSVFLVWGGRR